MPLEIRLVKYDQKEKEMKNPRRKMQTWIWIALALSGVATVVICLVMNFALIPRIEEGEPPMRCFDMCATGYSPDEARAFVAYLGPNALDVYLHRQLPLDFVYPVCYTVFFCLLWVVLRGRPDAVLALPLSLMVADYTENALVLHMLQHPTFTDAIARAASVATIAKTVLMYATFGTLAVAAVVVAIRAIRRRSRQ